jgi:hypothetical protein
MTYRTYHDDRLADELRVAYDWWVLGEQQLKVELDGHGLVPTLVEPGVYAVDRGGA